MKENMKTQQEPVMAILVSPSNKFAEGVKQLQRIEAKKQELAEVKKSIDQQQFEFPQGPMLVNGQWW